MNDLDCCYARHLEVGLILVRQALDSGDLIWLSVELELIHNIPSLLGEQNSGRHKYFWSQERALYINWMSTFGSDHQLSRMRTFYEPIWDELQSLIEAVG